MKNSNEQTEANGFSKKPTSITEQIGNEKQSSIEVDQIIDDEENNQDKFDKEYGKDSFRKNVVNNFNFIRN